MDHNGFLPREHTCFQGEDLLCKKDAVFELRDYVSYGQYCGYQAHAHIDCR